MAWLSYNLSPGVSSEPAGSVVLQQFETAAVVEAIGHEGVSYLGTGSFGETYRVTTAEYDVAYKIIYCEAQSAARLLREIEGYKRVSSPYVVHLHEELSLKIGGREYTTLKFEYIDGGDLAQAIERGRPTEGELVNLAVGLLEGLQALHSAELLHRDLKPANVGLRGGKYSHPVILDLGLAKHLDIDSITRYPQVIGSPLYMAPEQLEGERAMKASDLWAVGLMLYEAATGQHPFMRAEEKITIPQLAERLAAKPSVDSVSPREVAELIERCLSYKTHLRGTVSKAKSRLQGG